LSSQSGGSSVEWHDPFVVPSFCHDVELQLNAAYDANTSDGTVMDFTKGVKSGISEKLADTENSKSLPILVKNIMNM